MDENNNSILSENVLNSFESIEYTMDVLPFAGLYQGLLKCLPSEAIRFDCFDRDILIGAEIVCSAICHKINWDFLREAVYQKCKLGVEWLLPENLSNITIEEVEQLLNRYDKKERIMPKERCEMLRNVGATVKRKFNSYSHIFFDGGSIKEKNLYLSFFKGIDVFARDPQQKKLQLLFQSLTEYKDFSFLNDVCKPTIDYHLIRLYLRRGIVKPTNQYAMQYIFNEETARKENTIASLRKVCAEALELISWFTILSLKEINKIEWWIGRTVCTNGMPDCFLAREDSKWLRSKYKKCPFYDSCFARQVDARFLNLSEPLYKGSSY